MNFIRNFTLLGIAISSLLCIGCTERGRPVGPGKPIVIQILDNGVPLTEGSVDLSGQGGGRRLSATGEASFDHVPFGTYQVAVVPVIDLDNIAPLDDSEQRAVVKKAPPSLIPKKFRNERTTPLQIKVEEGAADRFEFDLKQ